MARKAGVVGAVHNTQNDYIKQLEERLAMYESEKAEIRAPDNSEYIKVMSLLNYRLNLCTKEAGQGKVFKFEKFGQIKKILYSDLVDIMEVHQNFLEAGYFYILNQSVIRHHGLDEVYAKILDKNKIEELLKTQTDEAISLYSSANKEQQETIIQLLLEKIIEDSSSINLRIVDGISRISGVDIYKKSQETKELRKASEEK